VLNVSAQGHEDDPVQAEQPLLEHLAELRERLLRCVLSVLLVFALLSFFAPRLYTLFATPLLQRLPGGTTMIATEVAAPLLVPLKLALLLAVLLCLPYLLYQGWAFVAPGLYRNERHLVLPLVISSVALFYTGIAFAYFLVLPLLFGFFIGVAAQGVSVMTDINHYFDFCLKLFIAFGIAFEAPVATFLLVRSGLCSVAWLRSKRPLVVVLAFAAGMALTPPDVISQFALALPMWLLFELGLLLAARLPAPREASIRPPPDDAP